MKTIEATKPGMIVPKCNFDMRKINTDVTAVDSELTIVPAKPV